MGIGSSSPWRTPQAHRNRHVRPLAGCPCDARVSVRRYPSSIKHPACLDHNRFPDKTVSEATRSVLLIVEPASGRLPNHSLSPEIVNAGEKVDRSNGGKVDTLDPDGVRMSWAPPRWVGG